MCVCVCTLSLHFPETISSHSLPQIVGHETGRREKGVMVRRHLPENLTDEVSANLSPAARLPLHFAWARLVLPESIASLESLISLSVRPPPFSKLKSVSTVPFSFEPPALATHSCTHTR